MAKIISYEPPTDKQLKEPPLESLKDWFGTLDKFTKAFFVTTLLLITSTPFIVGNRQVFTPHAATPLATPSPIAESTPTPTCMPRPACLDANPRCLIPEPASGWCPVKPTPTPKSGNISFVKTLESSTLSRSGNNSMTIYVQSPGVNAGDRLIISVQAGTFGGNVSCRDSKGNIYSVNGRSSNNSLFVCSANITQALQAGDTITATYPGFSGTSTISANEFSGITGVDGSANGSSTVSKIVSTQLLTTTNPKDLIFGTVQSKYSFMPASGLTTTASFNGLTGVYGVVESAGIFSTLGSVSSGSWNAIMIGYR